MNKENKDEKLILHFSTQAGRESQRKKQPRMKRMKNQEYWKRKKMQDWMGMSGKKVEREQSALQQHLS